MKDKVFFALALLSIFCLVSQTALVADCPPGSWLDSKTGKCSPCPEGMQFHPGVKRCVAPGEDPFDKADQERRRRFMGGDEGFCVDQWCCPDEASYFKCDKLLPKERLKCLKKSGCFIYGE